MLHSLHQNHVTSFNVNDLLVERYSAVRKSRQVPKTQCQADIVKYVADSGDNLQGCFDIEQHRLFLSNLPCGLSLRGEERK